MSDKFVVEGLPPLEPIEEIQVGEGIYQRLLSYTGKHPALINGATGESMTYAELLSRNCSLAESLRACGYGTDTTVLVSSKNHLQFFVSVIAALYIGARVTTMNPTYTHSEIYHVINISKPNIMFCSENIVEKYSELKGRDFIERL